jgi:DNA-binding NarL/FixJ family response regulator
MPVFRIAIVDEESAYRFDLRQALEQESQFRVIAEASNGHEALWQAESQRPDLILITRRLPGLTGVQVSAAIRTHQQRTRVILIVPVVDYDQSLAAVHAGAVGVLPRYVQPETLRTTVRSVLAGNDLLQSWETAQKTAVRSGPAGEPHTQELVDSLTVRELEVLDCLLMGLSTKETGSALGIADQTVKNRVSSILHKLRVDGRMGAIRLALSRGWAEYGPMPRVGAIDAGAPGKSVQSRVTRPSLPIPPTIPSQQMEQTNWG